MDPKVLKTGTAEFTRAQWTGRNTSGFSPMSDKVLILTDRVNQTTTGNIHLPDDLREKMDMGAESGIVAALGGEAFRLDEHGRAWVGEKAKVGDHVYFERYAGQLLRGKDGRNYRLMSSRCIGAIATDEEIHDFSSLNLESVA